MSSAWRAVEGALLFVALPVLQAAGWLPIPVLLLLMLAAIGCGLKLRADRALNARDAFRLRAPPGEWRRMLMIFALAALLLAAVVWAFLPGSLFWLPRNRPGIWLLVMVIYPLVSVYPQEIIFRAFFFHRYRGLFGSGTAMIAASSIAFAFAHITFHNWVAVALTLPGGILFGRSYERTRSLTFVACEHALYGGFVFTIGLGRFLLEGTFRLTNGG
jgi:membrane protease YdiL (CAAX protease family)